MKVEHGRGTPPTHRASSPGPAAKRTKTGHAESPQVLDFSSGPNVVRRAPAAAYMIRQGATEELELSLDLSPSSSAIAGDSSGSSHPNAETWDGGSKDSGSRSDQEAVDRQVRAGKASASLCEEFGRNLGRVNRTKESIVRAAQSAVRAGKNIGAKACSSGLWVWHSPIYQEQQSPRGIPYHRLVRRRCGCRLCRTGKGGEVAGCATSAGHVLLDGCHPAGTRGV